MREWRGMTAQTAQLRTLTFGDRRISYSETEEPQAETEKNFTSLGGGGGQFSDLDSGVCEDVCCEDVASSPDTERKLIQPDVSAIRELTNFDEVRQHQHYSCGKISWQISFIINLIISYLQNRKRRRRKMTGKVRRRRRRLMRNLCPQEFPPSPPYCPTSA